MKRILLLSALLVQILVASALPLTNNTKLELSQFKPITDSISLYLKPLAAINITIAIDSVTRQGNKISFFFSKSMADYSFRDKTIKDIYSIVNKFIPGQYINTKIYLYCNASPLEELSSKFYSDQKLKKQSIKKQSPKLVRNISYPYTITNGLQNKHIALWQSHGYYYDQALQRWEWQRARIFETVEDLYTQSYVLGFLVPMLEKAGANVFLPRERDLQINEVIVDNDAPINDYKQNNGTHEWLQSDSLGFANPYKSYLFSQNPFRMGTYVYAQTIKSVKRGIKESTISWNPNIPQDGEYAVYVSYKTLANSSDRVNYKVRHNGGETKFEVNQTMGGGTWIYLGTFSFTKGRNNQGVYLSNISANSKSIITADAVKFGGGMGNIARKPSEKGSTENVKSSDNKLPDKQTINYPVEASISNYPRFTEGARYWLQWAGYADSVYSSTNNMNDYNDDYTSRGRWVNTLSGGSLINPDYKGLKVPLDIAFAFHTDAGTFINDSIVGTLAIYTRFSNGSDLYPNKKPRLLSRELSDIIQTQIVDDVRAQFEPKWSRRGLWDRSYSESRSPQVPTMLLELLSHQNFADMRYGLDPNFRFAVSRAIYKAIVKYFSLESNRDYVIQPLPVKNFAAEFKDDRFVKLSWSQVKDTLEPSAVAKSYIVYTRLNGQGFDNGIVVNDTVVTLPIIANNIYSYKVAAVNEGGESFASEILSVGKSQTKNSKNQTVLIVNGFTRLSAPASFASKDSTIAGFYDNLDHGVAYIKDFSFIGSQHEFRRSIPWMDDDAPGFGASYANYEDKLIAGNTFDYPYIHGMAFMKLGYSFISASSDAIMQNFLRVNDYKIVDFIMGKQAQTKVGSGVMPIKYEAFPLKLQEIICSYAKSGGNILISGAYVGKDIWDSYCVSDMSKKFATDVLKFKWMTHYASTNGKIKAVANPFNFSGKYSFNTNLNDKIYAVEAADAIVPANKDAYTVFRYSENNISAAVAYKGDYNCLVFGFPLETLTEQEQIDNIISDIVDFFTIRD